MHAVFQRQGVPREVVVDLVEGGDVGDGGGEEAGVGGRGFGVPEAEDVLEGEGAHALEDVFVEEAGGAAAGGCGGAGGGVLSQDQSRQRCCGTRSTPTPALPSRGRVRKSRSSRYFQGNSNEHP